MGTARAKRVRHGPALDLPLRNVGAENGDVTSTLRRVPVAWTTGVGGAGVSVFYSGDTDDLTSNLGTFFTAIRAFFPNAVTWTIPAAGDKIFDDTGHLAGAWTGGTAATVSANGGALAYVAGTGCSVRWITGAIVGTHKLQGRTFLNPMLTSMFDTSGTMTDANVATIQAAATALVASNKLLVWHRPPKGGSTGTARLVIGATVADKVTSLRSRRV